jgi:alpha-mannosidase
MEQSAHCDWDWLATFEEYYNPGGDGHQAVQTTLQQAISYIQQYQTATTPYVYTFCEMGYLRRYLNENPGQIAAIKALPAGTFNISSGGIVSADNLLSHGEAFIRNYLIGRQWVEKTLGITPRLQMWIPDDFGHDAQLPIVLQAMGFMGAGFWRIPAGIGSPDVAYGPSPNAPSVILTSNGGLDFTWYAADGSSIQAHWLANGYCEGNVSGWGNPIQWSGQTQGNINTLIQENISPAFPQLTPYLFVPVDCDFCASYSNLPDIITDWNNCNGWGTGTQCVPNPVFTKGVYVVMATFDDFMRLVQAHTAQGSTNNPLYEYYSNPATATQPACVPNPYYSGAYGSRPPLKNLHYQATGKMLFAESMQIILDYLALTHPADWRDTAAQWRAAVDDAWDRLMPSTHHDYVTGTSGVNPTQYLPIKDPVYTDEQLPILEKVKKDAEDYLLGIVTAIASTIDAGAISGAPVAVFNSLGFKRPGIVETPVAAGAGKYVSSTLDGKVFTPVQYTDQDTILLVAEPPSIGYRCSYLTNTAPTIEPHLRLDLKDGSYVMENEFLSATISTQGITELYDLKADPQRTKSLLNGVGNQIVFYSDNGTIYRFGNEIPEDGSVFNEDTSQALTNLRFSAERKGELGVGIAVTGELPNGGSPIQYRMDYALLATESFLRMGTTGAAPIGSITPYQLSGYSVMVRFPFAAQIASLTYGTPYHWDSRTPRNYFQWPPSHPQVELMTFEPTHDFVIPVDAGGSFLGAIYHGGVPAWAIDSNGRLLGCILRNVPGTQNAAQATDYGSHTATYALRVPGAGANLLPSPGAGSGPGSPLAEALHCNNPMIGVAVPSNPSPLLLASMSVAETPGSGALVTAAKMGTVTESDLILRVYQPTNAPLTELTVGLDPAIAALYRSAGVVNVNAVTALEVPPASGGNLPIAASPSSFVFTAPFALTTLALTRL